MRLSGRHPPAMAKDGTIGGLWEALESCFKQAQLALDDWHIYIEDFEVSKMMEHWN